MSLPQLPPDGDDTLYPEADAASRFLGICPKSLERRRKGEVGFPAPPHIRIGRQVYYRGAAIRQHLLGQEARA
jgi:hypothetical protein